MGGEGRRGVKWALWCGAVRGGEGERREEVTREEEKVRKVRGMRRVASKYIVVESWKRVKERPRDNDIKKV